MCVSSSPGAPQPHPRPPPFRSQPPVAGGGTCGLHRGPGVLSPGSFCTVIRQLTPKRATTVPPTSRGPRLPGPPASISQQLVLPFGITVTSSSCPNGLLVPRLPSIFSSPLQTATCWKASGLRHQTSSMLPGNLPPCDLNITNTQQLPDFISRPPPTLSARLTTQQPT